MPGETTGKPGRYRQGTALGPMVPNPLPGHWAPPECQSWRAGRPRALTFNTGCNWDFQWMRVSFWSCENLGRGRAAQCSQLPLPWGPPHPPPGLGRQGGAWGLPHNTGEARGQGTESTPHRLGISHSREARSFFSALAPPLVERPASGGDRVTVCQRAGWEAASCHRRHTRAALEENL